VKGAVIASHVVLAAVDYFFMVNSSAAKYIGRGLVHQQLRQELIDIMVKERVLDFPWQMQSSAFEATHIVKAEFVRMVKLKVKTLFSISNATDAENKLGGKIRTNLVIWMPNWFYIILLACWLSIGFTNIELMELWKDGWIINIILTRQFS
jgi:hypothetical protein